MGDYEDGFEGFTAKDIPPVPEDEFCVYGIVYCKPEHADALERIYAETTRRANSDEEPGTLSYCICRDSQDRSKFHFYERYAGREAFEYHNDQDATRKIFEVDMFRDVKAVFAKPIIAAAEPGQWKN